MLLGTNQGSRGRHSSVLRHAGRWRKGQKIVSVINNGRPSQGKLLRTLLHDPGMPANSSLSTEPKHICTNTSTFPLLEAITSLWCYAQFSNFCSIKAPSLNILLVGLPIIQNGQTHFVTLFIRAGHSNLHLRYRSTFILR